MSGGERRLRLAAGISRRPLPACLRAATLRRCFFRDGAMTKLLERAIGTQYGDSGTGIPGTWRNRAEVVTLQVLEAKGE